MKNLIYLILLFAVCSCSTKDEPKKFVMIPNAQISIRPALSALKVKSTVVLDTHLSALEIVKQATVLSGYNIPVYGNQSVTWGFDISQRDTVAPALKMWATGIINEDGYVPDFVEARDLVLCRPTPFVFNKIDTIAYINNYDLSITKDSIKSAYALGDNKTVYRIFDSRFRFTPITGKEWRDKKSLNQQ